MEYKRLNTLIKSLDETKRMAMSMYQEDSETEFRKHYLNLASDSHCNRYGCRY